MGTLGYAAMFEQFAPNDLLKWSRMAEDAGFGSVMASDHFHPWTPSAGAIGLRLGVDGRAGRADQPRALWPRRHRAGIPLPSCHSGAGLGDAGGDVSWSLLSRHWRG